MAASNEEPLSAVKTTFECPGVGLNERPSVADSSHFSQEKWEPSAPIFIVD
ncbi:hypothetical protein [Cupriavidus sp. UYPR2.512]|uniref:hypothetical protein n=1 Tax=Cupriavidus sp. UYPR2.512 TaxID=1080187 RepID=UPI0003A3BC67|nr:hypothetical protein [Cupriavidus sp. UYPR2.512]UIF85705.1 hypothetical protein KAF44_16755 [Cupriavidus necator]